MRILRGLIFIAYTYISYILGFEGEEVWTDDDINSYVNEGFEKEWTPPTFEIDDSANMDIDQNAGYLCTWLIAFMIHLKAVHNLTETTLEYMLKFFYSFLCLLGNFAPICTTIAKKFPKSAYQLYKCHGVNP